MFKARKLLSAVLMLSLLLTLMAPAVFADAAPLSTDYTKYPNTLSLNLNASEAFLRNGTTVTSGEAVYSYLKWIPQYASVLPSLKDNADKLNWNPNHAGFKFFYNGRQMYENSSNPFMFADKLPEEYVPSVTISNGRLYYWFDGAICYLAKDKINILVIATGADYRTDVPRTDFDYVKFYTQKEFNHPEASTFIKLIENFEAAIAATNTAATPAISTDYTKYPNTLSLNLKSSAANPMNGTDPNNDGKGFYFFKWIPVYESLLGSLEANAGKWSGGTGTLVYTNAYLNSREYTNNAYPPKFIDSPPYDSIDYLPTAKLTDGKTAYCWYDGSWFYVAKDKINILVFANNHMASGNLVKLNINLTHSVWVPAISQPEFAALCDNFEAAIAAKNAAATAPVTTPVVTAAPGLVAHYKFEGNLTDSSGKGHNGSEVGALAYASGGASGQALKLENGGYVKIPGASTLNLGEQFTLNAWVKLAAEENDVNRYNTVLFKEHPTEPGYFIYKAVASGTHDVRLDIQQLSTGFEPVVGTDGVGSLDLSSKWTMATWVSDGDSLYVYVDGKLRATATTGKKEYGTPFSDTVASNLFIGGPKGASAELFNGQIDEVKLFSRALSGSEIKAEYDAVKGGGSHVLQLWIDQYRIVKDNQESAIDSAPVILNGRTMVPVRPIIEAMGGTVAYDPATRKIDLAFKTKTLTLWLDKYEAVVNGQNVTLEVAPTVINGRTMLPLRFAAESLGATVEWDKTTQKITLSYMQ